MPVDLRSVDLVSLIEQHAAIRFGGEQSQGEKRTRKGGPCPFCGRGNDRFAVFINDIPQHFYCGIHGHGCGVYGDAITFVREYLDLDFAEACELLNVDSDSDYTGPCFKLAQSNDGPPAKKWMDRAEAFCLKCRAVLLSEKGQRARAWLYSRGFTDATIQYYGLGLNLAEGHQDAKDWGTSQDVWVSRGIVIPWQVGQDIWKVNIRRPEKDIVAENARKRARGKKEDAPKYRNIAGGSNCLYGVDTIQPGLPLVIVEGEFDRLALLQAMDRQIAVVATGSTGAAREQRWIDAIRQASDILIAFDDDGNEAGDQAAEYWLKRVESVRWLPWSHDVNDMLREGMDIPVWLHTGLSVAQLQKVPQTPAVPVVETIPEEISVVPAPLLPEVDTCILCGALTTDDRMEFYYVALDDTHVVCYCEKDYPGDGPQAIIIAQTHRLLSRVPELKGCTMHIDPSGYSLSDRVRELVQAQLDREQSLMLRNKKMSASLSAKSAIKPLHKPVYA